jgi:hypothetical protein
MKTLAIELPMDEIRRFCEKWRIRELAVFGSILTDEFDDESDVDFMYTFEDDTRWDLFDLGAMQVDLTEMLGRNVDFVGRKGIERCDNPYKKKAILGNFEVIYESGR